MGYEVDFLPVGDGDSSGDAIALRFGNLHGDRSEGGVVVIDGGYQETGKKLAEHIRTYYRTDSVDLVISSHPDNDHSSGLSVVLEELKVAELWMHKPWEHTDDMARLFRSGRVTDASVSEALRKSLDSARDLERIANRKGIPIVEPFTGTNAFGGIIQVVGPTPAFYDSLLSDFRCTPTPQDSTLSAIEKLLSPVGKAVASVFEDWNFETLNDYGSTSAENNSSTIVLVQPKATQSLLFTADAGIPALTLAANALDAIDFDYNTVKMIQIPHHGSRRNVGPTILNRLLGPKRPADVNLRTAVVSASKGGAPKHPSKKVTNAFRRRGAHVYGTMNGATLHHFREAPDRPGWNAADAVPFFSQVEEPEADAA